MKILKYIFSVILLVGITAVLFVGLDVYQNQGFQGEKESEIKDLELVTAKENYSAKEVATMLLDENYVYLGGDKSMIPDDTLRAECLENVQAVLYSVEGSELCKEIETMITSEAITSINTYQCVGYMEKDAIVFTMVNVCFENMFVTYEEKTGVVQMLECYITENEEVEDTRAELEGDIVGETVLGYYEDLGISGKCVLREIAVEPNFVTISIQLEKEMQEEEIAVEPNFEKK